jgi:hypothetical protein
MWSFQSADGGVAVSVMSQGTNDGPLALGHVALNGTTHSVRTIRSNARYDDNGVQSNIELTAEDASGRVVVARCPQMHSYIGWRVGANGEFWGYEGVGAFDIDGYGRVPGAASYFWPGRLSGADLRQDPQ